MSLEVEPQTIRRAAGIAAVLCWLGLFAGLAAALVGQRVAAELAVPSAALAITSTLTWVIYSTLPTLAQVFVDGVAHGREQERLRAERERRYEVPSRPSGARILRPVR